MITAFLVLLFFIFGIVLRHANHGKGATDLKVSIK